LAQGPLLCSRGASLARQGCGEAGWAMGISQSSPSSSGLRTRWSSPAKKQASTAAEHNALRHVDLLTAEHLSAFRDAFDAFDSDGSGEIDRVELRKVLVALGSDASDAELEDMMNLADVNHSGTIDFWEFSTLMCYKMNESDPGKALHLAFEVFDEDRSGSISSKEIKKLMRSLGEPVSDSSINAFMAKADMDGSGDVNYEEFANVVLAQVKSNIA